MPLSIMNVWWLLPRGDHAYRVIVLTTACDDDYHTMMMTNTWG